MNPIAESIKMEPSKALYRKLVQRSLLSPPPLGQDDYIVLILDRLLSTQDTETDGALQALEQKLTELVYDMPRMVKSSINGTQQAEELINWRAERTLYILRGCLSVIRELQTSDLSAGKISHGKELRAISKEWTARGVEYEGVETDIANLREFVYGRLAYLLRSRLDADTLRQQVVEPLSGLYVSLMRLYPAREEPIAMRELWAMLTLSSRLYELRLTWNRSGTDAYTR